MGRAGPCCEPIQPRRGRWRSTRSRCSSIPHTTGGDHCGDHGRFWARSRSLARIMQLVASRTRRSLAEPGFGFWPLHSNQPRGRRSPTPRLAFARANAAPPARALWTARIKSPSCRHEVGLRNQLLRHGLGAVRCIGVDVLAYSPPPAAML
jgi:hypothetical protein